MGVVILKAYATPMPGDWADSALCAQTDPEAFFPEPGGLGAGPAKRMCARCEVRPECLEYAVQHRVEWGVWGGTGARERRQLWAGAA